MPAKKTIDQSAPYDVLGMKVRDVTSGFAGYVTAIIERIDGMAQLGVQPEMKKGDNVFPKATYIDPVVLEVTGIGIAKKLQPRDTTVTLNLSDKAEDTVTGLVGIVTERVTFLNGCVFLLVTGRREDRKDEAPSSFASHTRFRLVTPSESKPVIEEPAKAPPGGPTRDVRSQHE